MLSESLTSYPLFSMLRSACFWQVFRAVDISVAPLVIILCSALDCYQMIQENKMEHHVDNLNIGNISKDSWYLIPVWMSMESACCHELARPARALARTCSWGIWNILWKVLIAVGLAEQQGPDEDAQPGIWNVLCSLKWACLLHLTQFRRSWDGGRRPGGFYLFICCNDFVFLDFLNLLNTKNPLQIW